ncbi:uncharacterized protein LOC143240247 isoform X4 [Tachypleus tridentatus]|uniref:uncharacterized protein LOC143240247 isoform X4 n=1 Tax=Tachypleus tridentatus TaxID=6853 RepID=UPI003FD14CF8
MGNVCVVFYATQPAIMSHPSPKQVFKPANLLQASMTKCKNLRILFCDANSQVRMNYLLFLISVSLVQ